MNVKIREDMVGVLPKGRGSQRGTGTRQRTPAHPTTTFNQ